MLLDFHSLRLLKVVAIPAVVGLLGSVQVSFAGLDDARGESEGAQRSGRGRRQGRSRGGGGGGGRRGGALAAGERRGSLLAQEAALAEGGGQEQGFGGQAGGRQARQEGLGLA